MAAAAFVANVVFAYQDGSSESVVATCSDVTTEEWVWPDGADSFVINGSKGNAIIQDIVLSAAGTDCRTSTILVNARPVSASVIHAANLGTTFGRQFQQNPLKLPSGAKIEFTQLT